MFKRLSTLMSIVLVATTLPLLLPTSLSIIAPAEAAAAKTTICHRTNSTTNPYRRITVSRSSISGSAGHQRHDTVGVWTSVAAAGTWGDIIPDTANGGTDSKTLNWSAAGQAIWNGVTTVSAGNPACKLMTPKEFYDSEVAAGVTPSAAIADLNDQDANEDLAVLAAMGTGSFSTGNIASSATALTVTTSAASSVLGTTATVNGSMTSSNAISGKRLFEFSTDSTLTTGVTSTSLVDVSLSSSATSASANLTGLTASTTYYFRLVVITNYDTDTEGYTFGAIQNFTTGQLPSVTSVAASSVTSTGATLNGAMNGNGSSSTPTFEYSTSASLSGSPTSVSGGTATSGATSPSAVLTGLSANTTYYFRLNASSAIGNALGSILSFTTLPDAPTVTTNSATSIGSTSATISGAFIANGASTTPKLIWGTDSGLSGAATVTNSASVGTFTSSTSLTGLTPSTTYFFQAQGTNSGGTANGSILSFTTLASGGPASGAPVVTTDAATSVGSTTATINGTFDANGAATTPRFIWGTDSGLSGATTTSDGTATIGIFTDSRSLTSLTPGTTYYFRAQGQNSDSTQSGSILSFTTDALAPTATTQAASSIGQSTAVLNGTLVANGASTTPSFEYGTDAGLVGATTVFGGSAGTGTVTVTATLSSLSAGTTYYFRVIGTNSVGTTNGAILSFATSLPGGGGNGNSGGGNGGGGAPANTPAPPVVVPTPGNSGGQGNSGNRRVRPPAQPIVIVGPGASTGVNTPGNSGNNGTSNDSNPADGTPGGDSGNNGSNPGQRPSPSPRVDPLPTAQLPLLDDNEQPLIIREIAPKGPAKPKVEQDGTASLILPIGFKGRIPLEVTGTTSDGETVTEIVEVDVEGPVPPVEPNERAAERPRLVPDRSGRVSVVGLNGEVALSWEAQEEAAAYEVYRGDELVCMTVYSSCVVPAENRERAVYRTVAVETDGETSPVGTGTGRALPRGTLLATVYFDSTDDSLRKDTRARLRRLINDMRAMGLRDISIAGHTDTEGSSAYNRDLSQARAESVEQFLDSRVVDAVVDKSAAGKSRPAVPEDTRTGLEENRRVEIRAR